MELSESLVRIYDKNDAPDFWPEQVGSVDRLMCCDVVNA